MSDKFAAQRKPEEATCRSHGRINRGRAVFDEMTSPTYSLTGTARTGREM